MSEREHKLKTWPSYFEAVMKGIKPFEVRVNDRDYQAGDLLVLEEFDPNATIKYTGREIRKRVTYVMLGGQFDIPSHMCVMGMKDPDR